MRRLAVPFLATLAMLVILVGLGLWQIERLAWKTDLLARIDAAEAAPAAPFAPAAPPLAKVRISGRFRPDIVALYGSEGREVRGVPVLGAHLLGVLERADGPAVIVDRGWVPQTDRPAPPTGERTVEGWLRPGETAGWFAAPDDPVARRFYTLDPAAIGRALGLSSVAPFVLVTLGMPDGPGAPIPAQHLPRPKNDHLSYAITWFSLAAILLVVFLLYARKQLRA